MSDTPRMDASHYDDGVIWNTGRQLERELNTATSEIEEKRKDIVYLATEKAKLEERIKRMEQACRDMASEDTYNERDKEWFQVIESILGFHPVSITEALKIGISCIKNKNERIKRLEEQLMDSKNKHAVLVADVVLNKDRAERIKRLEDALTSIGEYWNCNTNERAMEDACWYAIHTAVEALQSKEAK